MMYSQWWWWLLFLLFSTSCTGWLDERPVLESINGHLYISSAKDKNITLKVLGNGRLNVNDINLLHAVNAAQDASRLVERWKLGVLNDVESTLQRLTHIVEGPNGLVRRLNLIEYAGESSANNSGVIKPSSDSESDAVTTVQLRAIITRIRRLENKVRVIGVKLRTDECVSDPCQNGGTCIDRYDGFQCHCPSEWEGSVCNVDVNECERYAGKPGSCQNGATCVNSPGTFSCICPSGWHGFHCTSQKSACDQGNEVELCGNGYCLKTNSPLGYTCICKDGWDHMGDNDPSCRKDINECKDSRYPCSVNPLVTCHNVPGTFYCGVCPVGYTGDGFSCHDIDECLVNNGGCSKTPFVDCINTLGSRKCGVCPTGYQGDGVTCIFVGTCTVNNGGCHPLATCSEGPNSEALCLCPSGYQGTGRGPQGCRVTDNACKNNPCIHGTCAPSYVKASGFECSCISNYTGLRCDIPINPCARNPCKNGGVCLGAISPRSVMCACLPSFTGPTCETPKQTCGGVLRNPIGSVVFPATNGTKYPAGLSCAWVLMTNYTMVLNITFLRFSLEESSSNDDCKNDYVQIHDGSSAGSYIIGRYCGSKLPNNGTIISTHNALYIWFKSDASISGDGFTFTWTSILPSCGGSIREDFGSISSPGYPGRYPTNRDCFWDIIVTPGKRIVIHFITIMLEEHPTCANDYLEVNETHYMGDHRLGLYCNHTKPSPITTAGNRVTVHFHSDSFETDSGFHLSYLTIPGSPDCGGVFTSESGEITSPGYHSGSYRSELECEWEIRLPEDTKVRLTWVNFKLEPGRNCIFDSVRIYQGPDTNSPLVGKYCGYNIPRPITVDSNRVLIRFESDANFEEDGFVLKYEVDCGGIFTEPSGIIKSPFYPNAYPGSKDCVYLISQPPGKAISVRFEFMDIEEGVEIDNETLCFDRLEIRDGDTENSTLLAKLCGPEQSMPTRPIVSTLNFMFLEFFTDSSIHNLGFKLNYTTIDLACGAILKEAPGSLTLPGPSASWSRGIDCYWKIRAPPNHVIQITWTAFPRSSISTFQSCGDYSYIELTEPGEDSEVLRIGRYCTIKPPPQVITTQGNDLTIHMKWGAIGRYNNIELNYVFINGTKHCGGHYHAERGYIRSPNYPEMYPKRVECIWVIEALNKYLVRLNFRNFQLENSTNCNFDYLEIRSGSQANSPLLGKFCGDRIENEITSMTNQMYIKFKTDSTLNAPGFELEWDSTQEGCGGTLYGSSGSIISPNYPENYQYRMFCTWDIHVAAGSVVKLSFTDFDISCALDRLRIMNVINRHPDEGTQYCGAGAPAAIAMQSNHVRLIFRSSALTSGRGFHLYYTAECQNKLTGFNGVIESPNFPQKYNRKNNCSWVISVPPGNKINVTFSNFNVPSETTDNCTSDYVKLQEGYNDTPIKELAKKCGYEDKVLPLKVSSNLRQMFVTFISSSTFTGDFRLEWYIDGCSAILTKSQGSFDSPGYPNGDKVPYPKMECRWLIQTKFDKSIEVTFPVIDTTRSRTCVDETVGSIEVYNGRDESANKLTHNLCYSDTPVVVTSTGNEMFIKYQSDIIFASRGFLASYRSIPLKCGGEFYGQSGAIHSTNYPKNYPHNQYCKWLITVDSSHAINLTFVDLDIERSRNCTDDYIKIYDGDAEEAPVLATHCGSASIPPYYVSSGNQMLVVMKTDTLVSAKGFKAYYNRTCGAHIKIDGQGFIRSSPTLHTSFQNNCTWILEAKDPSDKITLIFNHVDLLFIDNCFLNEIDIHEGANITGPLLGKICNNKLPAPFYSTGNIMTIHLAAMAGLSSGDNFDVTYSTFTNACGGKFTAASGIIASPNYPQSYPAKADCAWTIKNSPGNRISLTFEEFELQSSDNCHMDYVEVRDNDGIGKLHGVFCGKNVRDVNSTQNLWIRFKSAPSATGNPKGFKAEYNFLFGDELTGDNGEIASPMYPVAYRKGGTFSWRVTVDFNFVVKLEFTAFQLDNYKSFCFASLRIYDGYNNEAPLLQELCGIEIPKPIISTSNVVYIEMENTNEQLGNLFHLKYYKVPRDTASSLSGEVEISDNHETIILTQNNGTHSFKSPGFPNGYAEDLKYSWTFISPVGTHLVLRFIVMNLEESEDCLADYVAVYNGQLPSPDSKANPEKRVCLSNATSATISGTNVMTVQFVSDSYVNKTGFSATVVMECGGTIEESNGVIKFDNSWRTGMRPRYIYSCEWVVKVRTGRRVSVTVYENSLEDKRPKSVDNSCRYNYLILKNGESASSPLLGVGKYCNGVKPAAQNTSSNYLYVKLAVSFATVKLHLEFRELGHDCGGKFLFTDKGNSGQEITSPNYPNIPAPHTECFWTFTSVNDHQVSIHFTDRFDLAFTPDCEREYVEVRDGATDSSLLIGRYCKNTPPSTLTTSGNVMFVHYYTDMPEPRNGFKALITTSETCGGLLRDPQGGSLTSPNYPEAYGDKNYHCSWWIFAPTTHVIIRIQFEELTLPLRRNCSETDRVTIYEKDPGAMDGPIKLTEIGSYCGTRVPRDPIDILTSEAIVTFDSKLTTVRSPFTRGFRLNYTFSYNVCGGNLNGMSGNLQTTGYPRPSAFKYCSWKITVPEGYQVVLQIEDLDLDEDKPISKNQVSFNSDPNALALIQTVKTSSQSLIVKSSSNVMRLTYYATGSPRGMKARYFSQAPAPCGGILNNWEGTFTSPQVRPFNETAYYCKWIVRQPENVESDEDKKVSLSVSFTVSGSIDRVKGTINCPVFLSYITIKGEGDELMAKICGNMTKETVSAVSPFNTNIVEALKSTRAHSGTFKIAYKWHKCGGILTGPSNVIKTPKNVTYPVYCAWKVKYPDLDYTLAIKFETMHLNTCDKSYINIQGKNYRSPILGKFCGNEKPKDLVSATNKFLIEYYATDSSSDFEIHIEPNEYACGGTVNGKSGQIGSPGFPRNYPNNTECIWEINGNNGFHVGLTFVERFNIESSDNCVNDYIEVFEWKQQLQNKTDHWSSLGKVCGRIAPTHSFNSTTNKMKVKFVSNDKVEGDGFKAIWSTSCGGVYEVTNSENFIESPNYPSYYPPSTTCNYTLVAPEGREIIVDFLKFSLEGNSASCYFDSMIINIYDMDWLRSTITLCGEKNPGRKIAIEKMELIFKSDGSLNRSGFKFKYQLNDCGGIITAPRVIEPVINDDPDTASYTHCEWIITAPAKKSVVLRFEAFNISDTLGSCFANYLKIYEGNSTKKTDQTSIFCGDLSSRLPVVQSQSNVMTVQLRLSSYWIENRAFKAIVLFMNGPESGCGGNYNVTADMQFKTQLSEFYEPLQDCHWLFFASPGYTIQFIMNEMDLKNSSFTSNETDSSTALLISNRTGCYSDYIEVRDGGSYGELIGHFCGNQIPPPITTTSRIMWIRFISDGVSEGRGVKGTLKAVLSPCGLSDLTIGNSSQVLMSPNFPDSYPSEITCKWIIHNIKEIKRVKIDFKNFNLEDSNKCQNEFLEIQDSSIGDSFNRGYGIDDLANGFEKAHTVVIGENSFTPTYRYCGSSKPGIYYSHFKDVQITYKTTGGQKKNKGFKLEYGKADCSRAYTGDHGRILHQDISECRFTIEAAPNRTISAYFIDFFMPGTMDCSISGLEIREGGSDGRIIQTACNYEKPNPVFSIGNKLSFRAYIKNKDYSGGFYDITFVTSEKGRGCGGQLQSSKGSFTSPLYPNSFRNNSNCKWDIRVPRGLKIKLEFTTFDIGSRQICETDYVSISEIRENGDEDPEITYCGGDTPAEYKSGRNRVLVTYVTSINNGGSGWVAQYTTTL